MVSLFAKRMLKTMWDEITQEAQVPQTASSAIDFASIANQLGVRVVHIAERDTQLPVVPRPKGHFTNTWSVDGFILEGVKQCADIGWGTHERTLPSNGHEFSFGCGSAIRLAEPSAGVKVLTYVPTFGEQVACAVTHFETSSLADLLTKKDTKGQVLYRPTVHYAYQ